MTDDTHLQRTPHLVPDSILPNVEGAGSDPALGGSTEPAPSASTPSTSRKRITFFLPELGASGGVRTTIRMANGLRARGHDVRIAVPRQGMGKRTREWVKGRLGKGWSWAKSLDVPVVPFKAIADLDWAPGEIAIAVGSHTVDLLPTISSKDVVRAAWCKGFTENLPELMQQAWSQPFPKIAVSPTLVPTLNAYGGGPVVGVAPNGVDPEEYYYVKSRRTGIGLIYGAHWKKDPEFTEQLVTQLRERFPNNPLRIFGLPPRPASFRPEEYTRTPTVDQARALYNSCVVWLVTSRSEGFCNPILEAMSCGSVVISTAHESAPGLIHDGVNGILVPIGDAQAFISAIERVKASKHLRHKLVDGGHATATTSN